MLYISKIDDLLKILTDEEVKELVVINFSQYPKPIREEQNLNLKSCHITLHLSNNT